MKTYIFNTIKKYKRFSETLEVKEAICNKAWWVFNDSGEKELYIFQEDGTLYITYGGKVSHGTWKYIPANKSIIISAGEQSYMVHAAFMDSTIFALQVDGTEQHAFLIDEQNKQNFLPKSYSDVMNYFIAKEQKYLEEERRKKQLLIEQEKERQKRELEEERIRRERELKEKKIAHLQEQANEIIFKNSWYVQYWEIDFANKLYLPFLFVSVCSLIISQIITFIFGYNNNIYIFFTILAGILFIPYIIFFFVYNTIKIIYVAIRKKIIQKKISKWKEEHPDNPINKYLYVREFCKTFY